MYDMNRVISVNSVLERHYFENLQTPAGPASHTDERVKLNLKCCRVNILYNNQHHVTEGKEIQ